ncbi:response regulator transcription factor [Erysipelothrix sp. HDW6C]|uniref:response regulator transcription factor n=1 Tax=Erysipelothrix sp. HDW6C TaxID=2714930 RepID=UPI00140DC433|nr:response regulator transcription factor [Erysipelothrix sp. HDW6C]QIK69212.1 response regulator transcription factor [Erysipelothrix sp. HDW6C]
MNEILIVEDNIEYLHLLERILKRNGYEVDTADNPITGLELLAKHKYDLLISDLYLETIDGIQLITAAKNIDSDIKAIILTGKPGDGTELAAVENNVDLYLEKSKSMDLVLKYIEQVLKNKVGSTAQEMILQSKQQKLIVNLKTHEVRRDGVLIDLTPIEFHILQMFLERKNEKLTREEIIETVWGTEETGLRIIDVHIKNLRDKLNVFSIVTVRGCGYKWNESIV